MTLIWYVITFPIYFDISFEFEVKRKKKKSLFNTYERKKRQRKKSDTCVSTGNQTCANGFRVRHSNHSAVEMP